MIDSKADVVYAAAGLSGQGVIKAAAAHKIWAIGVDSDQYKQDALAKYKDSILTSAMKDVAGAVYNLAKSVEDGKPETGVVRADLASGGVGLADSNPVFKDNAKLQEALKKAEDGDHRAVRSRSRPPDLRGLRAWSTGRCNNSVTAAERGAERMADPHPVRAAERSDWHSTDRHGSIID